MELQFDMTAATVETPNGRAKFVKYNPVTKKVLVEHDHQFLVEYDGKDVMT